MASFTAAPEGVSEVAFRALLFERFNMSLGAGLTGVEMELAVAGIRHHKGAVASPDYRCRRTQKLSCPPRLGSSLADVTSLDAGAS